MHSWEVLNMCEVRCNGRNLGYLGGGLPCRWNLDCQPLLFSFVVRKAVCSAMLFLTCSLPGYRPRAMGSVTMSWNLFNCGSKCIFFGFCFCFCFCFWGWSPQLQYFEKLLIWTAYLYTLTWLSHPYVFCIVFSRILPEHHRNRSNYLFTQWVDFNVICWSFFHSGSSYKS